MSKWQWISIGILSVMLFGCTTTEIQTAVVTPTPGLLTAGWVVSRDTNPLDDTAMVGAVLPAKEGSNF